jgi:hypothetical protein
LPSQPQNQVSDPQRKPIVRDNRNNLPQVPVALLFQKTPFAQELQPVTQLSSALTEPPQPSLPQHLEPKQTEKKTAIAWLKHQSSELPVKALLLI